MPCTQFICPDGEKILFSDCMEKCRIRRVYPDIPRCAPLPYLINVSTQERPWAGKPSVTMLLKGSRENWLKIKYDWAVRPDAAAYRSMGIGGHSKLKGLADSFHEHYLDLGWICGTLDIAYKDGDSWVMYDYKFSGSYAAAKMMGIYGEKVPIFDNDGVPVSYRGRVKTKMDFHVDPNRADNWEYEMQMNMYRIMLFLKEGIEVNKMYNFVVPRDGDTRMAKSYGVTERTYTVLCKDIPDNRVLSYFRGKSDELLRYIKDDICPPLCTDRERWEGRKCTKYCEVYDHCVNHGLSIDSPEREEEE